MNIYIELEVLKRELESRILIGLNLKCLGNRVFLGHRESIFEAALKNKISSGVIFMKDVNSNEEYISIYKKLKEKGFKIVSQDEEGGYIDDSFELYSKLRHLNGKSFNYIDYYFCWGKRDEVYLSNKFKLCNFFITGSPRIDFCKTEMKLPREKFEKKYNIKNKFIFFTIQSPIIFARSFPERMKLKLSSLESDEDINYINKVKYEDECRGILILNKFIELIIYLISNLKDYDIVVRPHPAANPDNLKDLIGFEHKRLHIISDGFMSEFISHSDIIVHNSCTGALEAYVANKPVISFVPDIKLDTNDRFDNFPNRIGTKCKTIQEVVSFINKPIINNSEIKEIKNRIFLEKNSDELISNIINNIKIKSENNYANFSYNIKKTYIYFFLKEQFKKILKKYFNITIGNHKSARYIKFNKDFKKNILENVLENIIMKKKNNDFKKYKIKIINDSIFEII